MAQRTPSQTVGPYFAIGLTRRVENELVAPGEPGAQHLHGRLLDGVDEPIPDGLIEVWDHAGRRWGRVGTDGGGGFAFTIAKPPAVGSEAPRLDVFVFARGLLRHQLTRVYFPDEAAANEADPVLAALSADERATLVATADDGGFQHDIHLQGDRQTVFFEH